MRKLIRSFLQRFGYDIVKYQLPYIPGQLDQKNLEIEFRWLQKYKFRSIVDIGANEGQFSDKIRLVFPNANIYAFEPLPGVFSVLQKNLAAYPSIKLFNLGLGEQQAEMEFLENESSASSSFLPMTEAHTGNFEQAVKTKKVTVKVNRLDDVLAPEQMEMPLLVKIDVQGFEDKVIAGGANILKQAAVIICETSFVTLYEGQPLFADIQAKLKDLGFVYSGCIEQLRSPDDNQILQADAVFIKQS